LALALQAMAMVVAIFAPVVAVIVFLAISVLLLQERQAQPHQRRVADLTKRSCCCARSRTRR
jgi:hypothetical protein